MGGGSKGNDESDAVAEMVWREEKGVSRKVKAFFAPKKKRSVETKRITMAELAKHNKRDDLWICVEGHAYDVTKYVKSHPGGWLPLATRARTSRTPSRIIIRARCINIFFLRTMSVRLRIIKCRNTSRIIVRLSETSGERSVRDFHRHVKYITWHAVLFISACTVR